MRFFPLFSIVFAFPGLVFANAWVVANFPSGEYNQPILVTLTTDIENGDIFYYTDGEGNFDAIELYTQPIFLTKNTQLDFFAMTPDMNQTPIYRNTYTFLYTDVWELTEKLGEIVVKNISSKTQNLSYRILETSHMSYEISADTFIEAGKSFSLSYTLSPWETIRLYDPNRTEKWFLTIPYSTPHDTSPILASWTSEVLAWQYENTQNWTEDISRKVEDTQRVFATTPPEYTSDAEDTFHYSTQTPQWTEQTADTQIQDSDHIDHEDADVRLLMKNQENTSFINQPISMKNITQKNENTYPVSEVDEEYVSQDTPKNFTSKDLKSSVSDAGITENKLSSGLSIVWAIVFFFLFAYNVGLYFLGRKNIPTKGKKEI